MRMGYYNLFHNFYDKHRLSELMAYIHKNQSIATELDGLAEPGGRYIRFYNVDEGAEEFLEFLEGDSAYKMTWYHDNGKLICDVGIPIYF